MHNARKPKAHQSTAVQAKETKLWITIALTDSIRDCVHT